MGRSWGEAGEYERARVRVQAFRCASGLGNPTSQDGASCFMSWGMSDSRQRTIYECPRVKAVSEEDALAAWQSALKSSQVLEMGQGWLEKLQHGFRPARVRVGWVENALRVLAELEDGDIFNPSVGMNEYAYAVGDVFEIFCVLWDRNRTGNFM